MATRKLPYWQNKDLNNLSDVIDDVFYIEKWEYIDNCEGEYMVSSFGRLKSVKRSYLHPIKGVVEVEEKILSQYLNGDGYCKSNISINRVKTGVYVHRLVGSKFIDNPENKPQINHIKGIVSDNFYTHLEWVTNSENNIHAFRILGRKKPQSYLGKFGKLHHASKSVYCPTLQIRFDSARIASRQLGISQGTISHICNGKRVHSNGLTFKYVQ